LLQFGGARQQRQSVFASPHDVQTLHLARDWLITERTGLINQMRIFLLERGLTAPQGFAHVRSAPYRSF